MCSEWVQDLALPQLRLRSRLWLGFDPRPKNSICHGAVKIKKKKQGKKERKSVFRQTAVWAMEAWGAGEGDAISRRMAREGHV